jgi:hypothetical protein
MFDTCLLSRIMSATKTHMNMAPHISTVTKMNVYGERMLNGNEDTSVDKSVVHSTVEKYWKNNLKKTHHSWS